MNCTLDTLLNNNTVLSYGENFWFRRTNEKITQKKHITITHLNLGSILFLWSSIILFVSNFIWRTVMALISLPFTCTMLWEHRPSGKNNLRFTKGCISSSMPNAHAGALTVEKNYINRGYYMAACGYEFYLRVFNSISHSFAAFTREISS